MNCPRCHAALAELDRDGITIDRCESCRGIWLDRGELEKLVACRDPEPAPRRAEPAPVARRHHDEDDDDDDRDRRHRGRRSSWWEIFD